MSVSTTIAYTLNMTKSIRSILAKSSTNKLLTIAAGLAFLAALTATIEATYSTSRSLAALQHADFLYLPMLYRDLVLNAPDETSETNSPPNRPDISRKFMIAPILWLNLYAFIGFRRLITP